MILTVNIDNIKIRLFNEDQIIIPHKIENTPHYKLLCGEHEPYNNYYDRMHTFKKAKRNYMNDAEYLEFCQYFRYLDAPYESDYIQVKLIGNRFESVDGDHRLCILKKQKYKYVQVNIIGGDCKHTSYSNLINIARDVHELEDYVVIKSNSFFPDYYDYDDLDIMCKDVTKSAIQLQDAFKINYPEFKCTYTNKGIRVHLDLIPPNFTKLNFRYDLLSKFPYELALDHEHNIVKVEEEYLSLIFDRKVKRVVKTPVAFDEEEFDIYFPHEMDDLVISFLEWVWQPHKTRHILTVRDNFKNGAEFIDIVNKYTNVEIDSEYINTVFESIKDRVIE
jgi:hypothetical protein